MSSLGPSAGALCAASTQFRCRVMFRDEARLLRRLLPRLQSKLSAQHRLGDTW